MHWLAVILLSLWFLGVSIFLAVLFLRDLTPKAALSRIFNRLGVKWEIGAPDEIAAPYERKAPLRQGLHRPVLVNLETSEGSGQAVHPDVIYIPGGFGEERWTYWMACTPYPYGNAYYENPEVFGSHDGLHWTVPPGLKNPLVPSLKNPGDHNSDPDILFHANELWLFFRETRNSARPKENRIYSMTSSDGVHWSAPAEVVRESEGRMLLSPAIIHDGQCFVMWTIDIVGGALTLARRRSPDGIHWSEPTRASVEGLGPERFVWHIDVIQEDDGLSAMLVSCSGPGGAAAEIHYASSGDGGLSWVMGDLLLGRSYEFESGFQYRASLCRRNCSERVYDLWYTAANAKRVFSIAHITMARQGNKLMPMAISPKTFVQQEATLTRPHD